MTEKKSLYRFTIGFNPGDPAHRQVAELLNQQGRRKAQFLVNAILHYIHCPEILNLLEATGQPTGLVKGDMDNTVMRILKEREYLNAEKQILNCEGGHDKFEVTDGETSDAVGIAAIVDSLADFRKR